MNTSNERRKKFWTNAGLVVLVLATVGVVFYSMSTPGWDAPVDIMKFLSGS